MKKKQLEKDEGTIFRYGAHENTYLNLIFRQLKERSIEEVPDREILCEWIKTITNSTESQDEQWNNPPRSMVDMYSLVIDYYYNPLTKGSNSIKSVLPAVLKSSNHLEIF